MFAWLMVSAILLFLFCFLDFILSLGLSECLKVDGIQVTFIPRKAMLPRSVGWTLGSFLAPLCGAVCHNFLVRLLSVLPGWPAGRFCRSCYFSLCRVGDQQRQSPECTRNTAEIQYTYLKLAPCYVSNMLQFKKDIVKT